MFFITKQKNKQQVLVFYVVNILKKRILIQWILKKLQTTIIKNHFLRIIILILQI